MPKIYKRNCNNCREFYKGQGKYFCSNKCRMIKEPINWKGGLPKCINCNKKLSDYKCKKCRNCFLQTLKKEGNPAWKGGWENKLPNCINCNKKLTKFEYKRCKKCFHKYFSGEKNNFWKGGITPLNKRLRTSQRYLKWRKNVFERDNYTCRKCDKKGCYLEADHIKPFAQFSELRFDINNGRTLCKPCHREITFGEKL